MDDGIREQLTHARHLIFDAARTVEGAPFTEPGSFEAPGRATLFWRGPSGRHLTVYVFREELSYTARNETGYPIAGGALVDQEKANALWAWLHCRSATVES